MLQRTILAALGAAMLWAAPVVAQDTTGTKRDTSAARPAEDTTGARKDTVAVVLPVQDTSAARKDTVAVAVPVQDTSPAQRDTAAVVAPPQASGTAVSPGMTEADVRARWGDPIAVRTANDWTYLFYRNSRERSVGFYDVVFLQRGQVMDAVVRAPGHVYAGQSSSPEGSVPVFTPPQQPAGAAPGAAVTGVRVKPSP
jgi:hypothetical protein